MTMCAESRPGPTQGLECQAEGSGCYFASNKEHQRFIIRGGRGIPAEDMMGMARGGKAPGHPGQVLTM